MRIPSEVFFKFWDKTVHGLVATVESTDIEDDAAVSGTPQSNCTGLSSWELQGSQESLISHELKVARNFTGKGSGAGSCFYHIGTRSSEIHCVLNDLCYPRPYHSLTRTLAQLDSASPRISKISLFKESRENRGREGNKEEVLVGGL